MSKKAMRSEDEIRKELEALEYEVQDGPLSYQHTDAQYERIAARYHALKWVLNEEGKK